MTAEQKARLYMAQQGYDFDSISKIKRAAVLWTLDEKRTEQELDKMLAVLKCLTNKGEK